MGERDRPSGLSSLFWLRAAVAVYASIFVGWLCAGSVSLGTCGGDGGTPHAADGSAADRFCSGGGRVVLWLLPLASVLIGAALAYRRRASRLLWICIAVGLGLEAVITWWAKGLEYAG